MIFLESPWPVLFIGIIVEGLLAIALVRTGRGILLGPMAGVALLVLAGVVIERCVVTEWERVAGTIDEAAAALEANDLDRLLACISPSPDADVIRSEARWAIQEVEFVQVRIRNLKKETINEIMIPPTAKVSFMALVTGRDRNGSFGERTYPVALILDLRLESGRWLIFHREFAEGGVGAVRQ